MRSLIRWTGLAILGVFALPLFAADDVKPPEPDKKAAKTDDAKDTKKDDAKDKKADDKKADDKKADDKKADDKKDDRKDWVPAGKMNGELVNVDESKKTLKVKLTTEVRTLNQGEAQALTQAEADYARAVAQKNPQAASQAMQNIAVHQRNLYKVEQKSQEVEVPTLDDVKVRIPTPAVVFDDDGKIKKPTSEELKKLKGDPSLPGYPGEFSSLHAGQKVTITLLRKKDAKPPTPERPNPGGKPAELDLTGDYVPHVSMIVIVYENSK
jgi:hypothetical protein